MKRLLILPLLAGMASTNALAWGLGDIGGQLLKKGAEGAVNSAVNGGNKQQNTQQAVGNVKQEGEAQAQQAAETLNAQQPPPDENTVGGAATSIASDAASQAAGNAMAKSGIPGAGVAGNVAGGLVKGVGGLFKKKPAPAPAETTPTPAPPTPQY